MRIGARVRKGEGCKDVKIKPETSAMTGVGEKNRARCERPCRTGTGQGG